MHCCYNVLILSRGAILSARQVNAIRSDKKAGILDSDVPLARRHNRYIRPPGFRVNVKRRLLKISLKPWKGDVSLTHRGAKRSRGADRHPHILEASPGGREASKPALAKAREFLTIQPGFAADPGFPIPEKIQICV